MIYRVEWTSPAVRDIGRLPARIIDAVLSYVDRLATDPGRMSHPLEGELAGLNSSRVGDYRILFRIDHEAKTIFIRRVDHRAHVYRPR